MHPFTTLFALLIDAIFGYPQRVFTSVGHPVSWMGWLIAWCESRWNQAQFTVAARRLNGTMTLLVLLAATAAVCIGIVAVIDRIAPAPLNILLIGVVASTLIAQRSLDDHVTAVAEALAESGLEAGRHAVSMIVGRDTEALDEAGVSRAAIESLAENYSDGVVAPLFWLLVVGLPGAGLYKAINTADSMIGHKSERYLAFGWAAARLDDLVNLPASRLSALLMIAAAAITPRADARAAMESVLKDARRHRSPNAGWPESAMAGALGLALAGPRVYGGKVVDDAWMGSGRRDPDAADIRRALQLVRTAHLVAAFLILLVALVTVLIV